MKMGYISDLHIDINERYGVPQALKRVCKEKQIDVLYLGGDTFNSAAETLDFCALFEQQTGIPVYSIFGNHEYYFLDGGFHDLRAENQAKFPSMLGEYGVIADTGWYDYTWALTNGQWGLSVPLGKLRKGHYAHGGGTWSDHRFIKWPADMEGDSGRWFTNLNLKSFEDQNTIISANPDCKKKILMLHMVPQYFLLSKNPAYAATNAFFGCTPIAKYVTELEPEICFFGHTHDACDVMSNNTRYICRPLGYADFGEWGNRSAYERIDLLMFTMDV